MELYPDWIYDQSGVIPFRIKKGEIQILLITSRSKKRWVIPKGIIEDYLSPEESAIKEAYEEAGIEGHSITEMGKYQYNKWNGTCKVKVFLLEVDKEFENWPESWFRKRKWMSVKQAEKNIEEQLLRKMISYVPEYITSLQQK